MRIGVIGLGSMGSGAAANLVKAGHEVTGCDVRESARDAFVALGGYAAASPVDMPPGIEALVVFVLNAQQEEDVLFGAQGCVDRLASGAVVLLCTTVAPAFAAAIAARLEERGFLVLDAPVSGGSAAASAGTMTVMASGNETAFAAAAPVLDAVAGKVWRLGDKPGIGSTVKMVNQLLAGVHIAAAAEAMALGIRAGADPQSLFDVISTSAGNSWMFQDRVPHILNADETPRSAVNVFVKDLGIVLDQGRALTFPLPLASAAHQVFLATSAAGHGQIDDAFVIRFWQNLTGIELPKGK